MKKLERTIMTTTDQHDVIEAINALNESGKKAFAWDKLGAYLKQNGGIYYSGLFFAYAKPEFAYLNGKLCAIAELDLEACTAKIKTEAHGHQTVKMEKLVFA